MKPHLLRIPRSADQSFSVTHEIAPRMYNQWHYHAEAELIYIVQGSGTIFIGDTVKTFKAGDVYFIGSRLPHLMRSDAKFYDENSELIAEAIIIHFDPEIFSNEFLKLPENTSITNLLQKSLFGLGIMGNTRGEVIRLINSIRFSRDSTRLIQLLTILNTLANSAEVSIISHHTPKSSYNETDENRLNRIYQYTLNNFLREISLKEIAGIVHMTPHSFCRYFKSRTSKRYSSFLLEIKVSHACKLLIETEESIGVICYESGFTNCSNFNRHFKAVTGKTPLNYRKTFRDSGVKNSDLRLRYAV